MRRLSLLLCVVMSLPVTAHVPAQTQQSRTYRIGIVVDGPWERNQGARQLLEDAIMEVMGQEGGIEFPPHAFLVGDWTLAGVRVLNDRLLQDQSIDMVLGMGLIASQDLATRVTLPKPVIAPVVIGVERQHISFKGGVSGKKNLSYLVYPQTFERDLKLFQELVPIRKLVDISSRRYEDALPPPLKSLHEVGTSLGIDVTQLFLDKSADSVLKGIPKDADAVYLEPILHISSAEFQKLVDGLIERRLPSFSFFGESEVRRGIMASANPDILPRLVRRIAINVRKIIEGEDPGSLEVGFTPGKRLILNMSTAYAVGVSPKWSTLLESELVQVDTTAPGGLTMTLAEAIRRFSEENLDVKAAVQEVNAAAENIPIARSVILPKLDISATGLQIDKDRAEAGGQPERSGTIDVSASQVLFAEPAFANISVQSSLQESRMQRLAMTRLNTIVEGGTYYLNYLRTKRIFFILLENLRLARTNLELARVRQTTGAAGQEETLRWEAEIADLRKNAMVVQSQMNQAMLALKQALNIPLLYQLNLADVSLMDTTLLISDSELQSYLEDPVSFDLLSDFLVSEGTRQSPEIRQIDAAIAAQERSLTSTQLSFFLPTIAAFGKYSDRFAASEIVSPFQLPPLTSAPPPTSPAESYLYQVLGGISPKLPGDRTWSVGVQLSFNLFNGFATVATAEQGTFALEQYRLQRKSITDKVALNIRAEMERAKASKFSIQQAQQEEAAARKALDLVTESYSRGAISILSVLDAQNSALRADQVAANAQYDFLIDYLSLQRSIGVFDVLMTPQEREEFLRKLKNHMATARNRSRH